MVYRRGKKKKITKQRETSLSKDGKQCGRKKLFGRGILQRVGSRVKVIEKRLKGTVDIFNYKMSD